MSEKRTSDQAGAVVVVVVVAVAVGVAVGGRSKNLISFARRLFLCTYSATLPVLAMLYVEVQGEQAQVLKGPRWERKAPLIASRESQTLVRPTKSGPRGASSCSFPCCSSSMSGNS